MRLVVGLLTALVLVGCSPSGEESPEPVETTAVSPSAEVTVSPSAEVSPSVSPSPTPTVFQSYPVDLPTEDAVSAAIIAGWQEYQRVYEKFASDPFGYTDFTETQYVTTGRESVTIINRIQAIRERDMEFLGGSAFRNVEIGPLGIDAEGLRTATVSYCADMNGAKVRNRETGEVSQRSGTYLEQALMVEGRDETWRVSDFEVEETQC